MPKKSTQSQSKTQEQVKDNYKLSPNELDSKRIYFKARVPDKGATQQMCFPKFLYNSDLKPTEQNFESKGQTLLMVTGAIKMVRGGIPQYSERYHGPDRDGEKRGWFYIPRDDSNPECVELFNGIKGIDDYMDDEINVKKNVNSILCYDKKQVRTKFKGLTYKRMITTAKGPKTLDFDDDDNDTKTQSKKPFVPYDRIKVKLSMLYDPEQIKTQSREINTQVFIKDNETAEQTSTISDIEKHLTWNCTAQFALMFNKVWIQMSDEQNCGISIKCVQMCILDKPEQKQQSVGFQLNKRMFARGTTSTDTAPTPTTSQTTKKTVKQSSDDESSDNDDEDDDESDEDDDEDDKSEPESEEEKPVVVKNKNTSSKKDKKSN